MFCHVTEAKYVSDYTIHFKFNDGLSGDVDLTSTLWGEVFEALKEIDNFKSFKIGNISQTIEWSNGADLAPEYLYSKVAGILPEDVFDNFLEKEKMH